MKEQAETTGPDLTIRETFRTWARVSVRYNDLDPLGHVNNTAMAIFLEQARCELITPRLRAHSRHLDMVLASTKLDYLKELHYPGEAEIGTIATRIGTKSFELVHGVFQNGVCAGTGSVVMVVFDLEKRASAVPPPDVRALLESLQYRSTSG
jgi:acyl-CoA thioester hydrolase